MTGGESGTSYRLDAMHHSLVALVAALLFVACKSQSAEPPARHASASASAAAGGHPGTAAGRSGAPA